MVRNLIRSAAIALGMLALPVSADEPFIILQSTTSTQNSGLFDHILPWFEAETGIDVRVVAVGTGQAIKNAINGDADVLLVHSKADEQRFVADGWGVDRFDVMYNDFVLVGPKSDPAGVKVGNDIILALADISVAEVPFASRGDDSGTHKAEMRFWADAGVDPTGESGSWYRETGSGMGTTLNVASGMGAYVLTDRATWLSFGNRGDLEILVEGDPRLFNQYGVTLVNPDKHPGVRAAAGQRFIDWLIGPDGQSAIETYTLDGEQLFFPNAQ